MPKSPPDFLAILRALCDHHVDFIVIGGVSAVIQGAPLATFDLEIRVLNLATLIKLREELGRDKDLAGLAVLRRTLEERSTEQVSQ